VLAAVRAATGLVVESWDRSDCKETVKVKAKQLHFAA
jgi:hypothetical protein